MVEIWEFSIVKSGLLLTLMPASMSFFAIWFGKIADFKGFRPVVIPGLVTYSSLFLLMWVFISEEPSLPVTIPALVGSGIGMASVWPTLTSIGASGTEDVAIGSATSVIHTIQRIGGALGIAIVLAVTSSLASSGTFYAHRAAILIMPIAGALTLLLSLFLKDS
jgi:MFS family permease